MDDHTECWAAVIGAGIAGAAAAATLASQGPVVLIEMESQPGHHATGRSAASYSTSLRNALVDEFSRASRGYYWNPPSGCTGAPLMHPRPELHVAKPEGYAALDALISGQPSFVEVSRARIHELCPVLRPDIAWRAALDESTGDLDVAAILQAFLRRARAGGACILSDAPVISLSRTGTAWQVRTTRQTVRSQIVVNAGGAWADQIAALAGLAPLGLVPRRRTALLIDAPPTHDIRNWPFVIDAGGTLYFKPDAGRLLISPVDETPAMPADAQPEELDIAIAVDCFERSTMLNVGRVSRSWAGLRTFAHDRCPVIGFDPRAEGFFWHAGFGGYGIQVAPAAAALAGALVANRTLPAELADTGLRAEMVSPARLL